MHFLPCLNKDDDDDDDDDEKKNSAILGRANHDSSYFTVDQLLSIEHKPRVY